VSKDWDGFARTYCCAPSAVATLLSTALAQNVTACGSACLCYVIEKDAQLPQLLERTTCGEPIGSLLMTDGTALLIANATGVSSLSIGESAGVIALFAVVNDAIVELAAWVRGKRCLSLAGALCIAVWGGLIWETGVGLFSRCRPGRANARAGSPR
jgi:hypothetical protein